MSSSHVLISLLGEVALLLWGVHLIHSGVLRVFGSKLKRTLGVALSNRGRAFLAGLGVTLALQSSTATALMTSSFAASGLVKLTAALAVMLGANIGTALIVQALSFDLSALAPLLLFIGYIAHRRNGRGTVHDTGRVLLGLGLVLLSLQLLKATVAPTSGGEAVRFVMEFVTRDPLMTLLVAAGLTFAAHSSVATVLLAGSLAATGLLSVPAVLAVVLGANLGSALNPVLQAWQNGGGARLRLPLGNLMTRLVGCAIALPLLPLISGALANAGWPIARAAADAHLAFNVAMAALFILPLPLLATMLERLLPDGPAAEDPARPHYLDASALTTPSVALSNAAREVLRMADVVEAMLKGSHDAFHSDDRKRVAEISRMDDTLDRLFGEIQTYLAAMDPGALTEKEARRLIEVLSFAINLEHAGDVLDKNLMELADKRIKTQLAFAPDRLRAIDEMHDKLVEHLQLAVAVFMLGDTRAARRLVEEKEELRRLERELTQLHFADVCSGSHMSMEASSLILDIMRDLKRIGAHVAATAHPLLEESGELRPSRLSG